ncbi:MAG: uroporphyrinogen-III synthase [Rickettsiales bacterium]
MILITRPVKQAEKTKKLLATMGYACKIFPLLKIEYLWDALTGVGEYPNVIVTSVHAAKVIIKAKRFVTANFYVVGQKVADLLTSNNYTITRLALRACELNIADSNVVYISGDHIATDFACPRIVVYNSIAATALPSDLLIGITTILFYSPRTAKVFRNLQPALKNIKAICISFNTAIMLKDLNFHKILIAENPTEKSMLKLL